MNQANNIQHVELEGDLEYLTVGECTALLRYRNNQSIMRMIKKGIIPAVAVNRKQVLVPKDAFIKFLVGKKLHMTARMLVMTRVQDLDVEQSPVPARRPRKPRNKKDTNANSDVHS
jgi:hypothetical protein